GTRYEDDARGDRRAIRPAGIGDVVPSVNPPQDHTRSPASQTIEAGGGGPGEGPLQDLKDRSSAASVTRRAYVAKTRLSRKEAPGNLATTYWKIPVVSIGLKTGCSTRIVNREVILACGKCLSFPERWRQK